MISTEENIFLLPDTLPQEYELFQSIISNENVEIEKIISTGQKTPEGQWLQQDRNEWVLLLQGESELSIDDGTKEILKAGDYLFIPKDRKHRVEWTSKKPPCIWLAVYFN